MRDLPDESLNVRFVIVDPDSSFIIIPSGFVFVEKGKYLSERLPSRPNKDIPQLQLFSFWNHDTAPAQQKGRKEQSC